MHAKNREPSFSEHNIRRTMDVGGNKCVAYVPWVTTVVAVGVAIYFALKSKNNGDAPINPEIQKENSKVVHTFDIEDLEKKVAYCRCWRSAKFPYCDGTHAAHNDKTGDNVGPLVLQRRSS